MAMGTELGSKLRRPSGAHDREQNEAISFAAYRALLDIVPGDKTSVYDP